VKILITGASGFIGRILAASLGGHELVLWSRNPVPAGPASTYCAAGDLRNTEWWQNAEIPQGVDVVIHLAEPVKTKLTDGALESVLSSHCAFLEHACARAHLVVYPDTAYRYDRRVGSANRQYLTIKTEVLRKLSDRENFASPIIHPLVDSGGALARLIEAQSKIPVLNPFCAFKASIPVLTIPELVGLFRDQIGSRQLLKSDWYSGVPTIATLTRKSDRRDWLFLSRMFRSALTPLSIAPTISLLKNGRQIPSA
jgi:hypothetical protein